MSVCSYGLETDGIAYKIVVLSSATATFDELYERAKFIVDYKATDYKQQKGISSILRCLFVYQKLISVKGDVTHD